MYRDLIEDMLLRYGEECSLEDPDQPAVKTNAMIYPKNYRYANFGGISYEECGVIDDKMFIYIGSARYDLSAAPRGMRIAAGGRIFRIDSAFMYRISGEAVYCRAEIKQIGDDVT